MKQTIFFTLVFSLFSASCIVTAEPTRPAKAAQQGEESLANGAEAASENWSRGVELAVDPEPQPWNAGGEVAVDPEPQPWRGGGARPVSVDPEPQPWSEPVSGEPTPTTNPTSTNEPVAATK